MRHRPSSSLDPQEFVPRGPAPRPSGEGPGRCGSVVTASPAHRRVPCSIPVAVSLSPPSPRSKTQWGHILWGGLKKEKGPPTGGSEQHPLIWVGGQSERNHIQTRGLPRTCDQKHGGKPTRPTDPDPRVTGPGFQDLQALLHPQPPLHPQAFPPPPSTGPPSTHRPLLHPQAFPPIRNTYRPRLLTLLAARAAGIGPNDPLAPPPRPFRLSKGPQEAGGKASPAGGGKPADVGRPVGVHGAGPPSSAAPHLHAPLALAPRHPPPRTPTKQPHTHPAPHSAALGVTPHETSVT